MRYHLLFNVLVSVALAGCAYSGGQGTIGELDSVELELKDVKVDKSLERAIASYQQVLEKTPESAMTPEAMRRLADLQVEKEYGTLGSDSDSAAKSKPAIKETFREEEEPKDKETEVNKDSALARVDESERAFEARATKQDKVKKGKKYSADVPGKDGQTDKKEVGARQAIKLYNQLLTKYPNYERNDQVMYQLARAHEELGDVDKAKEVMTRLIKTYPKSRYLDEVFFRRGEYYFTRKKYLDAEDAYKAVLDFGVGTVYYERTLYKLGWTFYKQELYEDALKYFITLLDHKVGNGYDFDQTTNKIEKKRMDDTFRVISLSFSNMGGADAIYDYFKSQGKRKYEDKVYSHLGEFFFNKRRYSDAAATYDAFIKRNPMHKVSPVFSMRVIEIYHKGHFPKLVIEAKKQFASTYALTSKYWTVHNKKDYPEAIGFLKKNITDLANHYHAVFQEPKYKDKRQENFTEAEHWYREFLASFPKEKESPDINYQLSELLLENKNFSMAAIEYEKTAYDYPLHKKSEKAAYAAVYAHREHLKNAPVAQQNSVKRNVIRSSLRLVDTYPKHEKANIVLSAAVDDMFEMKDYPLAIKSAHMLLKNYPGSPKTMIRNAWLVIGHSSFDTRKFVESEEAYVQVLSMTEPDNKERVKLMDNLAISIYRQGEAARDKEDYKGAVRHFLRIAKFAPASQIRSTAEYDAAAVLIQIMDLEQAAVVLLDFRKTYPGHKLQKDVTKKLAYVYKESNKYGLAAVEFERIFAESNEEDVKREALLTAADLYEKAKDTDNALKIYKQFVKNFPKPVEFALETNYKIAMVYKTRNEMDKYHSILQHIIRTDATAGSERTDRTRYLAAQSSLVLVEPRFEQFVALKLTAPFKKTLKKKKESMKSLVDTFNKLVDYKVGDVTAASTYYIAEIYYNFSRSLMESERPKSLNELELEQYNLMIEDQAFPFEEKAISVHEKNMELLTIGVYSNWIEKSIGKLAKLLPARYAKPEQDVAYLDRIDRFSYVPPKPKVVEQKVAKDSKGVDKKVTDGSASAPSATGTNNDAGQAAGGQPLSTQPAAPKTEAGAQQSQDTQASPQASGSAATATDSQLTPQKQNDKADVVSDQGAASKQPEPEKTVSEPEKTDSQVEQPSENPVVEADNTKGTANNKNEDGTQTADEQPAQKTESESVNVQEKNEPVQTSDEQVSSQPADSDGQKETVKTENDAAQDSIKETDTEKNMPADKNTAEPESDETRTVQSVQDLPVIESEPVQTTGENTSQAQPGNDEQAEKEAPPVDEQPAPANDSSTQGAQ